jgi:hypothetical protein
VHAQVSDVTFSVRFSFEVHYIAIKRFSTLLATQKLIVSIYQVIADWVPAVHYMIYWQEDQSAVRNRNPIPDARAIIEDSGQRVIMKPLKASAVGERREGRSIDIIPDQTTTEPKENCLLPTTIALRSSSSSSRRFSPEDRIRGREGAEWLRWSLNWRRALSFWIFFSISVRRAVLERAHREAACLTRVCRRLRRSVISCARPRPRLALANEETSTVCINNTT